MTSTRSTDALGPIALLLAAFCAVIVFFPPEGRVSGPVHDLLVVLLGRATFMLPLALAVVGVIRLIHGMRPSTTLPRRRLAGVVVIAGVVAASEQLMANGGDGTGLVGAWLSGTLVELFGGRLTTVLLVVLLGLGIWLAFEVRWPKATPPATTDAES